ncbi:MAG: type III pantothenate kinase [Acidimicrobiales bacterium]|nr:type III pantothenate kinase [Acidimicrobiales bacterium]
MLFAIDVGNTNTVFGLYDANSDVGDGAERGLVDHWRIATDSNRMADEHAVLVRNFLTSAGYDLEGEIDGIAICSGVPRVTVALRDMIARTFRVEPIVVGPGVKTGMPIQYENPREVGADRIANSVAAFDLFGGPTVVVDFGTGNNFDVISADGEFLGGAIAPGIEISLDALFGRAAALGAVEMTEPRSVIGKNTVEALQSGAVYGFAAQVDGMLGRFRDELGEVTVVATGGLADLIAPVSKSIEYVEPFLTLHGLRLVHAKNT